MPARLNDLIMKPYTAHIQAWVTVYADSPEQAQEKLLHLQACEEDQVLSNEATLHIPWESAAVADFQVADRPVEIYES